MCEKLRESPALLVFDQCEVARARILQVVRQIHDRTAEAGVGVVLLAAPILLARLSKISDYGALASRILFTRHCRGSRPLNLRQSSNRRALPMRTKRLSVCGTRPAAAVCAG